MDTTVRRVNRLGWYLNRLRAMSPAEIRHRLMERLRTARERRKVTHPPVREPVRPAITPSAFEFFQKENGPRFFFRIADQEAVRRRWQTDFADELEATLREAKACSNHVITLFGREFQFGDNIRWHDDPLTGNEWPQLFWADINTRDGHRIGGIKWVWELNRHHHLVTLAKAYFLTGDERYSKAVCAQVAGWIDANPPLMGVNWTSSLELAIRLINWTWALAFIRQSPALDQPLFGKVLGSIAAQAGYITRHHTAYSSANNHLIGEAAGLVVVGFCFPWLPEAERWRESGLRILAREIENQIHPDGVPAEQAVSYLAFILDFSLIAWRLAELNGDDVPPIWYQRLSAAADFITHVMDEGGHVPRLGDGDDAWVVRLDDRPQANNYRSLLATAGAVLNRPELKASADRWDEKSHWLLGDDGLAAYEALPPVASEPGSRAFESGGYCVMRAPGRVLTCDCGPLGFLSIAAHGHADALSLTLSADGYPLLIDPGTFAYQEGGIWRDHFRSTYAHNTVVVDRQNQSEMLGAFIWGRKATAKLLEWQSSPTYDFARAEHDGYVHLGVVHRRSVLFLRPQLVLVADKLEGNGEHRLEQLWHLGAGCRAQLNESGVTIVCHEEIARGPRNSEHELPMGRSQGDAEDDHADCLRWRILPIGGINSATTAVVRAETSPIQGWISPSYGVKQPGTVIRFAGNFKLPARLVTAICLGAEGPTLTEQQAEALALLDHLEEDILC